MTEKESKKLQRGAQVIWENDPADKGTVTETGYNAVKIAWDNGQVGVIHRKDLKSVSLAAVS